MWWWLAVCSGVTFLPWPPYELVGSPSCLAPTHREGGFRTSGSDVQQSAVDNPPASRAVAKPAGEFT